MELFIFNELEAARFQPNSRLYAIRITFANLNLIPLIESELILSERKYNIERPGTFLFGRGYITDYQKEECSRLVTDFSKALSLLSPFDLMVSCTDSKYLSPAIAIGLNNRFGLGLDSKKLSKRHPKFDRDLAELIRNVQIS